MEDIVIATSNPGKLEEFKELLRRVPVKVRYLAEYTPVAPPEEAGRTFAANAKLKAAYYAKILGTYCLADDSGLEVRALDGAPGVRSARYAGDGATDEENNNLLLLRMKFKLRRSCRFRCALAVAAPDGRIVAEAEGSCDGMLLHEPIGKLGFGYDPLFWSTELHKSLGEASQEDKNRISHRARAVRRLLTLWKKTGLLLIEEDFEPQLLEEEYDPKTDIGTAEDVHHIQHAPLMKKPEPRAERQSVSYIAATDDESAAMSAAEQAELAKATGTSLTELSKTAANLLAAAGQVDEDEEETDGAIASLPVNEFVRSGFASETLSTDEAGPTKVKARLLTDDSDKISPAGSNDNANGTGKINFFAAVEEVARQEAARAAVDQHNGEGRKGAELSRRNFRRGTKNAGEGGTVQGHARRSSERTANDSKARETKSVRQVGGEQSAKGRSEEHERRSSYSSGKRRERAPRHVEEAQAENKGEPSGRKQRVNFRQHRSNNGERQEKRVDNRRESGRAEKTVAAESTQARTVGGYHTGWGRQDAAENKKAGSLQYAARSRRRDLRLNRQNENNLTKPAPQESQT